MANIVRAFIAGYWKWSRFGQYFKRALWNTSSCPGNQNNNLTVEKHLHKKLCTLEALCHEWDSLYHSPSYRLTANFSKLILTDTVMTSILSLVCMSVSLIHIPVCLNRVICCRSCSRWLSIITACKALKAGESTFSHFFFLWSLADKSWWKHLYCVPFSSQRWTPVIWCRSDVHLRCSSWQHKHLWCCHKFVLNFL